MIARIWHGKTLPAQADDYLEYLRRTGVRGCRTTPGNRGVFVLGRPCGDAVEFVFLSL